MKNKAERLSEFTNEHNERLLKLLDQIEVSSTIDQMAEQLREPIKQRIRQRIRRNTLVRKLWLNTVAAASVMILGGIGWLIADSVSQSTVQYITQTAPNGIKAQVVLPDGSTVSLNGGTTLSYPTRFGRRQRAVTLDGEAFFSVVPNSKCPFTVATGCVKTSVLGTTFNIDAHSNDDQIEVTLASGLVEVDIQGKTHSRVRLTPGQQVTYDKLTGEVSERSVQLERALSWRDDKFYFEAEPLALIARRLERAFNAVITIDSSLNAIPFTGEFANGENLEQVLKVISADNRIRYTRVKNKISISKR